MFSGVVLVFLAVLAVASFLDRSVIITGVNPANFTNVSGNINLSTTIALNNSDGAHVVNVSFMWRLKSNNSLMFNETLQNTTLNQTVFNTSFSTTSLPDGKYNISIMVTNATGAHLFLNHSAINVTIDNTAPSNVTLLNSTKGLFNSTSGRKFNISTGNITFNVSVFDKTSGVNRTLFQFDNASGNSFNLTGVSNASNAAGATYAINSTSLWNISYDVSKLRAGSHTLTILVYDYAVPNNVNSTQTLTFTVNTAPNVTVISSPQGGNYTASNGGGLLFNVSAQNSTTFTTVKDVIFQFDNATGNDFNVTASNPLNRTYAKYWNITYNVSKLVAGNHTVTVFANDTNANLNNTITVTFVIDKTAPTASVSCTPSSVQKSAAAPTCTCTTSDSGENQTGVKTTTFSPSLSTATVGTITTQSCTAVDYAGNEGSATGTFTVTAATSSGGGAGGSGGGSSSSAAGQFAKTVWTSILTGETATVAVENGEVGISEISFDVTKTIYGAWVSVNKKDSFPSSVVAFAGKEYKKLEISKGPALKEDTFENAKVKFKVLKTWLAENQLEKGGVALFHYEDSKWSQLSTAVGEDDGTYVHYTAETPGFSYFVIGEREGAAQLPESETAPSEGEAPTAAPSEAAPTGEAPAGEPAGAPAWPWALVALVVIGVAVALYLMKRK